MPSGVYIRTLEMRTGKSSSGAEKIRERTTESWKDEEVRLKRIFGLKESWLYRERERPDQSELMKKNNPMKRPEQRERMKNGGAAHMNSFIKNPSRPQVKLYNLAKSIYSDAEINRPLELSNKKWCSLDIAIPSLMIDIEYDGSYYHQDEEKDRKRQYEIEDKGWKVIRYRDYVPTKEELMAAIGEFNER